MVDHFTQGLQTCLRMPPCRSVTCPGRDEAHLTDHPKGPQGVRRLNPMPTETQYLLGRLGAMMLRERLGPLAESQSSVSVVLWACKHW